MREPNSTLTEVLMEPILANDPAGPRITWYDDANGARIELSALTLNNWAAKTANLIRDEFALTPGGRVAVLLHAHWQTAAVLLGCWWAGAEVVLTPDPDADVALCTPDRLDDTDGVDEVAVLSLDAMGMPVRDLPVGVTDFATAVRVHGDQFLPGGAGAALDGRPVQEVVAAARLSAKEQEISTGDRVLSTSEWKTGTDLIEGFLAILAAGASLVQVANPDESAMAHRTETERVTVRR